jgi:hypothetical protein
MKLDQLSLFRKLVFSFSLSDAREYSMLVQVLTLPIRDIRERVVAIRTGIIYDSFDIDSIFAVHLCRYLGAMTGS